MDGRQVEHLIRLHIKKLRMQMFWALSIVFGAANSRAVLRNYATVV
jgi:hypothetical protein